MPNAQNPLNCRVTRPITDRNLSGVRRRNRWLSVLGMFGAAMLLGGCAGGGNTDAQQSQQDERLRREASRVFSNQPGFDRGDPARVFVEPGEDGSVMTRTLSIDGAPEGTTTGARAPIAAPTNSGARTTDDSGWAILLERISGPQHEQRAAQRAGVIARALGRSDVRTRLASSGSAVVVGGYSGPDDQRAQRDLQYVKSLSSGGTRPYAMAILVPPPLEPGSTPQYDLTNAAKSLESIFTHTLQVAVFAGDEPVRRADAERYAQQLRRRGVEAFYFHGRRVSSVTIGTFTAADFDLNTGVVSPRLDRLQEEFPHNLYNGEVQRDPQTGEPWNSALVQIPRLG